MHINTIPDAFLRTQEAADYLRIARSTLEKYRLSGEGPLFSRVGKRVVIYRLADLDAWVGSRSSQSNNEVA